MPFWTSRIRQHGIDATDAPRRFGDECVVVRDPSGLVIELVASGDDQRQGWHSTTDPESSIRGLHSVTMIVAEPEKTMALMTGLLGYQVAGDSDGRIRLTVNGSAPGHIIDIVPDRHAPPATNGIGTVHHVAMAIGTDEEQLRLREDLVAGGYHVTPVRDRQYFRSIYFREPGGVLFEVATIEPGFLVDEELRSLGRDLKLPPWEEPHRAAIEARLPQVSYA
jgi:glyoxalase family protein